MKTREQNEVTRNASGVSPPDYHQRIMMEAQRAIDAVEARLKQLASVTPCARVRIFDTLRRAGRRGATFEEAASASGLSANTVRGRLSTRGRGCRDGKRAAPPSQLGAPSCRVRRRVQIRWMAGAQPDSH